MGSPVDEVVPFMMTTVNLRHALPDDEQVISGQDLEDVFNPLLHPIWGRTPG